MARPTDESPDANRAREAEIEARRAELLQTKLLALQNQTSVTWDTIPARPERLVLPPSMAQQFEGRTLRNIRLAGISMSTEDFLARAQVPIRVGDTLTQSSIEATVDAVKKFDGHLGEKWTTVEPNSVDLTIHAAAIGVAFARGGGGGIGAGVGGGVGAGEGPRGSVTNNSSAPAVIYRVSPDYTPEAKTAQWQGSVLLSVIVEETGKPTDIKVVKALGLGLDEKAVEAVEQWRWKPGMKDGKPVAVAASVRVDFRLP